MPPRPRQVPLSPSIPSSNLNDHRKRLESLRDRLTEEVATANERNIAGIARQLQSVLEALAQLPTPDPDSALDKLIARQAARREAEGITLPPSRLSRGTV